MASSTPVEQVDVLPDRWLECRDFGHAWTSKEFTRVEGGYFRREATCLRCNTIRKDIITRVGAVYGRTYTYPDGYQIKGAGKGVARAVFRVERMTREGLL